MPEVELRPRLEDEDMLLLQLAERSALLLGSESLLGHLPQREARPAEAGTIFGAGGPAAVFAVSSSSSLNDLLLGIECPEL